MTQMRKMISKTMPLWIILSSLAMAVVMIMAKPPAQAVENKFIPPLVETQPVVKQNIRVLIESQGTVSPRTEIILMSEVSGKIEWMSDQLQTGATFSVGDVLLKLEKRDFELAMIAAESNLSQARVNFERELAESELAEKEWKRIKGKGKASDLTLRKPQLAQAKALLAAAEAGYEQAERNFSRADVKAPFSGRVRSKNADVGMVVSPGVTLAQVYATDFVEVTLPIAEQDLEFLDIPLDGRFIPKDDQPKVTLYIEYAGKSNQWKGKITRSSAEIDSQTRMLSVMAQVSDPYKNIGQAMPLKVGMFVKAKIEGKELPDIVIVPRHTVRNEKIWVVDREGILRQKSVEILRYERDMAYIYGGLDSTEAVLLTRLGVLIDGMKLNQKQVEK